MKNKLILCSILAVGMTATLCGCGDDNYYDNYNTDETTTTTTTYEHSVDTNTNDNYTYKKNDNDDDLAEGEYWCMGKGDTCHNKTSSPTDLYCHSCDPDDNNIEGDQRTTDGVVGDNDGNGTIDEHDWETEWNDYLNNKYDGYGYDDYGYDDYDDYDYDYDDYDYGDYGY